jgi:hypothetical protein
VQPDYSVEEAVEAREEQGLELFNRRKQGGDGEVLSLDGWVFGDDQTRSFYQGTYVFV